MSWSAERTDDFDEWWDTLTDSEQRQVVASVEVLEEVGPTAGRPLVDSVEGSKHSNMKELRVSQTIWIFFAFDPRRIAILLLGGDKAGRTKRFYKTMLPRGDRIYDAHLRSIERKGAAPMANPKKKEFKELSDQVRRRPGAAEEIDIRKQGIRAALQLNELREQRRQTQAGLAELLETTQANVSRMEHTENLYLRTLNDYVVGLGGRLEINAVFDDDVVPIGLIEHERDKEREPA